MTKTRLLAAVLAMMGTVLLVSVTALDGGPSARSRKADKIIKKHIEALGGFKNIKALKTLRIRGRLEREGFEFPFTLWMERPNHTRMDIDVGGQRFVQAYNGKTAWWVNPLLGAFEPQEMPKEFAKSTLRWVDFEGPLVDYKKKRHKVEYLRDVDSTNGTAHVLKLFLAGGDVWHVYIDTDTYLEVKRTYQETFKGATREVTAHFPDYSQVEGVNMYRMIDGEGIDGTRYTMTFDSIDPNVTIEENWFDMPEGD
ncbi:MAG: hypothetical protein JSW58_15565 [Candidatus Latescibacterota bacterium]|nr:MAG: hypothetical protein JSW58_15565 [Candidatus Latescibacterota bacterium]